VHGLRQSYFNAKEMSGAATYDVAFCYGSIIKQNIALITNLLLNSYNDHVSHLRNHDKIKVRIVNLIFCDALKKKRFYCKGKLFRTKS